jgi:uncharacterized membrane protein YhhN
MPAETHAADPVEPHGTGWHIGWALAGFAPFITISVVHLAAKVTGHSALEAATKAMEIPTLGIALGGTLLTTRRKPRVVVTALLFVGLALSWLGDVTLNSRLAVGLAFFLAAHLIYIAMFELAYPRNRPSAWSLLAIPWFLALVIVVGPQLGVMLPSVVAYSAILGVMAIWSTRGTTLTTVGALLFVVSDTILAFRTFTPRLQHNAWKVLVMATYLPAQALIASGILSSSRAMRTSGSPVSSSIVSWPSSANPQFP